MIRDDLKKSSVSDINISSLPSDQTTRAILAFLEEWFPIFREEYVAKMPSEQEWEDGISQRLNLFLQVKAKSNNFLFQFNGRKGVDFSIVIELPDLWAKPVFVIEAKRLPPTNPRDYVQGPTGGIERFKREKDGFSFERNQCAMVAYVQRKTFYHWFGQINNWLTDLIEDKQEHEEIIWEESEKLVEIPPVANHVATFISHHSRKTLTRLTIHHFWLDMQKHISAYSP